MTTPDALPTGDQKARVVREMFDRIAGRYDLLNRTLTFGLDVRWRRRTIRELALPAGARVLDLACGTGDLCRELARAGHRPVGVDFAAQMLARARTRAPLVQGDVLQLPFADGGADGVVCGFALRNVVDLGRLFAETARVLRPGGRVSLLEVSEPSFPPLAWGHAVWFRRFVPLVGGLVSDRHAYRYLPASAAYLPPGDGLVRMVAAAGFTDVRRLALTGGVAQLVVGTRTELAS